MRAGALDGPRPAEGEGPHVASFWADAAPGDADVDSQSVKAAATVGEKTRGYDVTRLGLRWR